VFVFRFARPIMCSPTTTLWEMVDAVRLVLADDGVFVFEASYLLDTVQNLVFDFILYHEHLCYHSVRPMEQFLPQPMDLIVRC
jgi:hypothetical protein